MKTEKILSMPKRVNFGMMQGAYFVSKTVILNWVREQSGDSIDSITNLASGVHLSKIMYKYDKKFPLKKIKMNSPTKYDFAENWRVLQHYFESKGQSKTFQINKIIQARNMDNLEVGQWFYAYCKNAYDEHPAKETEPIPPHTPIVKRTRRPLFGLENATKKSVKEKAPDTISHISIDLKIDNPIKKLEEERDYYFNKLTEVERACVKGVKNCERLNGENDNENLEIYKKILEIIYDNGHDLSFSSSLID